MNLPRTTIGKTVIYYHPVRLLGLLTSGRILTLIPRSAIRFSMIPVQEENVRVKRPH